MRTHIDTFSKLAAISLALILFLPAHLCADGTQTGTVTGTVTDVDERVLPGVQVTLQGPDGRRVVVTDDAGRFRFPALRPGVYALSASLLSLTDQRDGIVVYIGRTSQVALRLAESQEADPADTGDVLPGPSESVQVVALAPLVDPLDTRVRSVVRREFLDVLPLERFYQSVALLLPDVAGGEDGNPNVGGALRSNNLFLIDGVDTTDPVTGLFGLNLAYEAIESVEVMTAGLPAELGRASGAVINVVTRSSDGAHRGTARWSVEPESGESNVENHAGPSALAAEINAINTDSADDQTLSATLGGPVLSTDRAWYFVAGQDGDSTSLRPTLAGDLWDAGVSIEAAVLRLGWRLGENHTFNAQYTSDSASSASFSPLLATAENTTDKPPSLAFDATIVPTAGDLAAVTQLEQTGSFAKIDWNAVLGPSWTVSAAFAGQDRILRRSPSFSRGLTGDAVHADITRLAQPSSEGDLEDLFDEVTLYNGLTDVGREVRPRGQTSFSLGWFKTLGKIDHDFRFGFDTLVTESETELQTSGLDSLDREFGTPVSGQIFFDLRIDETCAAGGPCSSFDPATGSFTPFFLFNIPTNPVTRSRSSNSAVYVGDAMSFGRWLVDLGLRWERQVAEEKHGRELADHHGLAPRLGVKYDAKGDGSTLYSLHVGRYFEPFPQGFLDGFIRQDFFSGASIYGWGEAFGVPTCAGSDPTDIESDCWFFLDQSDVEPLQEAPIDPDLRRTRMDEVVVGYERRLGSSVGLHLHWVSRRWEDLWDDVLFADPELGLDSVTNIPEAERRHQALRLLIQKRFADHWQLLLSITRSKTEGNLFSRRGEDTFFDFRDLSDKNQVNRYGPAPYDRPSQLHLFALYELPLKRVAFTLGTALVYESGTPWQAVSLDEEEGAAVYLEPRGSRRLEDFLQWDLSLTADIETRSELELLAKLELFNVLDEQTQTGVETQIDLPGFGQPRNLGDLQNPRRLRFSLELRF